MVQEERWWYAIAGACGGEVVVSGPSGGEISMVVAGSWLVDASEEDSDSLSEQESGVIT